MAAIQKFVPVAIGIKGGVISAFEPGSVKLSPTLQRELYRAGGSRPKQAVVIGADPVTEFSVPDITLFTTLTRLSEANPLTLYFAQIDGDGIIGTTYLSIACTSGLVEPVTISGNIKQRATLAVRIHHLSADGDTVPFTVGTSAPTGQVAAPGYLLAGVAIDGALLGVQSWSLTFGYAVKTDRGENGKPYGILAYSAKQDAVINVQLHDLAEATENRLHFGSTETTLTAQFRLLSASNALPVDSGGYLITAAKAQVEVGGVNGAEEESTLDLVATLLESAGSYLSFGAVV